jgi:hypothetical protein
VVRAYPYGVVFGHVRPPPDESERAAFGQIAIVAPPQDLPVMVRLHYEQDETRWGEDERRPRMSSSMLGDSFLSCRQPGGDRLAEGLCYLFVAPILVGVRVVAAAAGAAAEHAARYPVSTHSSATEGKDEPLQGAKRLDLQERVRDRLVGRASAETNHRFAAVPNVGPRSEDTDAYQDLGAAGVDTVVEVRLSQVRLIAVADEDPPPLGLFMQAQTRLVKPSSATVTYRAELEYRGAPRSPSEWTADEHRLLVDDVLRGCDSLADKIFDEVFLLYAP